jgi:hypothetical protein
MTLSAVMAGLVRLVPTIHVFDPTYGKDVDARDKRGHDESKAAQLGISRPGLSLGPLFEISMGVDWRLDAALLSKIAPAPRF